MSLMAPFAFTAVKNLKILFQRVFVYIYVEAYRQTMMGFTH